MLNVNFEDILNIYNNEIKKNVKNKRKIYEFEKYKITYLKSIYETLTNGNIPIPKYNIFLIKEPKYRIIMSVSIYDKIINHYISRYIIEPKLNKYLNNRNVATRKNMGARYGTQLVKKYIEEEKRQHQEFYILKLDISKYFYSIDHEVLKNILKDKLDEVEYNLIKLLLDSTNQEYINQKITKLKEQEITKYHSKSEEIKSLPLYNKNKGLAIGMMTNQFLAIFYLYQLHNYIIHKLKLKHTVIYMDDYIIMHHDKQYLKECLKEIEYLLNTKYKLKLNIKKTNITSSKEGFIFLEYKYKIINNKTIITLRKETLNKIKRNIKKNNYLIKKDNISFKNIFSSINNYQNTFIYDKIKVSRIIDKYFG